MRLARHLRVLRASACKHRPDLGSVRAGGERQVVRCRSMIAYFGGHLIVRVSQLDEVICISVESVQPS